MNTRPVIGSSPGNISLSAVFNDDATCFAVGLETGFCVFTSEPCELRASRDFNAGIGLASMLGQTNYVALVGGGQKPKFPQNKIIIWDDSKQRVVITLDFPSPVLRTLLSKSLIVVALRNAIQVYQFSTTPRKIHEFETGDNSDDGLVCLAPNVVAFPGRTAGQVQLVDLKSGSVSIIPAHETRLRALALSRDGLLLATAGEKGTLIRLYATSNCAKVAEFRRGIDPAEIYSISFNPSNSLLAVTSDKSTLHIFDLPTPQNIIRWQTRTTTTTAAATTNTTPHNNHNHTHNHSHAPQHPFARPSFSSSSSAAASSSQPPSQQHFSSGHSDRTAFTTATTSTTTTPSLLNLATTTATSIDRSKNKWGFLQNVPLLPRLFSDTYSFASATFELGDDALRITSSAHGQQNGAKGEGNITPWGKPTRGLIGWTSDDEVVVISAGRIGRWEKFAVVEDDEGKRYCVRRAWKQFLKG